MPEGAKGPGTSSCFFIRKEPSQLGALEPPLGSQGGFGSRGRFLSEASLISSPQGTAGVRLSPVTWLSPPSLRPPRCGKKPNDSRDPVACRRCCFFRILKGLPFPGVRRGRYPAPFGFPMTSALCRVLHDGLSPPVLSSLRGLGISCRICWNVAIPRCCSLAGLLRSQA